MSDYKLIRVQRYRTPTGAPTCASGPKSTDTCKFMAIVGMKSIERCVVCNYDAITRVDSHAGFAMGYTIPLENCPVWADEAGV